MATQTHAPPTMKHINYPSITQFQQLVELKDFRKPTKKEYVRYVRKLAEHFQCDPATLTENQIREYFLFLRQHKHYSRSPMKMAKYALLCFMCSSSRSPGGPSSRKCVSPNRKFCRWSCRAPRCGRCSGWCVSRASAPVWG